MNNNARIESELRIIQFKLDEVGTALHCLLPHIELDIPGGEFVLAASDSEQETPSTSFVLNGGDDALTVSYGKLAASLIHYCRPGGISVPSDGNKEIYVSGKFIE